MRSKRRRASWILPLAVWAALAAIGMLQAPVSAWAQSRIVSLSPDKGPPSGGTHVTIQIEGGVTMGPLEVRFGNQIASRVYRIGLSALEAVTPPGKPGPVSVEVINGLWGTRTPAAIFTYLPPASPSPSAPPPPRLLRLEPSAVPSGSADLVLHAEGEAFGADSKLQIGEAVLPTTVVSPQRLEARLPAALLAKAGTLSVLVTQGKAGETASTALSLTVTNPIPEMTELDAPPVRAGALEATVIVRGRDFRPDSRVLAGDTTAATTYRSPEELTAVLPAAALAAPGSLSVRVVTPGPGGGSSNPASLTIQGHLPGRFVAFTSNRRGGHSHIYLLDRDTQKLDSLEEANSWNATDDSPSISADGRFIVFQSDRNHGQFDVFLFDCRTRKLDPLPELNSPTAFDGFPRISADGRFIVFESDRLNGRPKVFLFDRETRTVSALTRANEPMADNGLPAISN
jgi:hypothetical protein